MRRLFFCLVMLQGLILPLSLFAAHRGGAVACAQKTAHPHRPASRAAVLHSRATHPRAKASAAHSTRKSVRLEPVGVETTALIDPVPLGRVPVMAPLKGSHESLLRQNVRSQHDGLFRVEDDADLVALRREELVALPVTPALAVDERAAREPAVLPRMDSGISH